MNIFYIQCNSKYMKNTPTFLKIRTYNNFDQNLGNSKAWKSLNSTGTITHTQAKLGYVPITLLPFE